MFLTILIIFLFLCLIGIGITLIIMNNRNLNKINDKSSKTDNFTLMQSKNLTNQETFGPKVSLEYDSNKRYRIINLYGDFNSPDTLPNISLAYSDTGDNWNVSGDTEAASLQKIGDKYDFMLQVTEVPFKYVTVYVSGQLENFSCYMKLST